MLIHPVVHEQIRLSRGGATIAAQWYWPPAVGNAERNSAMERASARFPTPDTTRPQITALGPPLGSASDMETDSAVHVLRMANVKPSSEMNEKFRCSTGSWPSAATTSSSVSTGFSTFMCS